MFFRRQMPCCRHEWNQRWVFEVSKVMARVPRPQPKGMSLGGELLGFAAEVCCV